MRVIVDYCDECGVELDKKYHYTIYSIRYWDKWKVNSKEKDFILDNDLALLLCSKKCLGDYISDLIDGKKID